MGPDQAIDQGQGRGAHGALMKPEGAIASTATLGGMGQPMPAVRSRTTEVSPRVEGLEATAYEIPTDQPESDGTLEWNSTTVVIVQAFNGRERGIGYTYGDRSVATLIESSLAAIAREEDAMRPSATWAAMRRELRNAGRQGVGAMAISAVDIALWDLKARLLGLTLADALPRLRDSVPVYGSGGFTSYDDRRLREQLRGWIDSGIRSVKIKVGREAELDPARVAVAREAIGPNAELMVDANGAYALPQALGLAERFAEEDVSWLEEPLGSEDLDGLAELRGRSPAGMAIAAGEYVWSSADAQRLLEAGAVDVLQADVTRCGGVTPLLSIGGPSSAPPGPFSPPPPPAPPPPPRPPRGTPPPH